MSLSFRPYESAVSLANVFRWSSRQPSTPRLYGVKTPKRSRIASKRPVDPDITVFRFTLGIPGFDDANIPRLLGCVGLGVLLWNRIDAGDTLIAAQVRSEVMGCLLSMACIAVPSIGERLADLRTRRGRATVSQTPDVEQCFLLDGDLGEEMRRELAWSSYALLKCTNVCTVLVIGPQRLYAVRGFVRAALAKDDAPIAIAMERIRQALPVLDDISGEKLIDLENDDRRDVAFASVHPECRACFVQRIRDGSFLIALSDSDRPLSRNEQMWMRSIATKLETWL